MSSERGNSAAARPTCFRNLVVVKNPNRSPVNALMPQGSVLSTQCLVLSAQRSPLTP